MNDILKAVGIIAIVILIIGGMVALYAVGTYNGLVQSSIDVDNKWAKVQTAYQRRADLIPNLVSVVKAYSNYEGSVLIEVTNARARVGQATTPQELSAAGDSLNNALSRLLVVVENYPELKANENYLSLQDELAGTENRVKVERDNYNDAVKAYNTKVRVFPSNIVAGMFGFDEREMFAANPSSQEAPKVNMSQ